MRVGKNRRVFVSEDTYVLLQLLAGKWNCSVEEAFERVLRELSQQ